MKKYVDQLAHNTLQKLNQQLLESSNAASLTDKEIIQVITDVINGEYKSCKKSLRPDFYKKLSLLLHSDRLARDSKYNALATYLQNKELIDEPQKILIEVHKNQSEKPILNFLKEVFRKPNKFTHVLLYRILDNPLITNLQRYPGPFGSIITFLSVLAQIGIAVALLLGVLGAGIVVGLIRASNSFIDFVSNKITDNKYQQIQEQYKTANFSEYKKQFLAESKEKICGELYASNYELYDTLSRMDDSEFWSYLINIEPIHEDAPKTVAEEIIHKKILTSSVFTLDKIKSIFFATHATIIDADKGMLQRVIPLIAFPFLSASVVLADAISFAQSWFFAAVNTTNLVSYYLTLMALNMPLVGYDASVAVLEYFLDKDIVGHEVNTTKINKTPLYLLFDKPVNNANCSNSVEPVHMSSPLSSLVENQEHNVDNLGLENQASGTVLR